MHRRASYAVVEDFEVKVSCFLHNSDIPEEDKCRYKPPEAWEVWVCGFVCVWRSILVVYFSLKSPSRTCDVWSATCNVVLMVTSKHPWEGLPNDDMVKQQVHTYSHVHVHTTCINDKCTSVQLVIYLCHCGAVQGTHSHLRARVHMYTYVRVQGVHVYANKCSRKGRKDMHEHESKSACIQPQVYVSRFSSYVT